MISIAVAFVPLALYFFALAALNSGSRARVLNGQEDLTALALGLIGFVMIGPMLFFLPVDALAFWGFYTWFFLALLYALIVWFLGAAFRFRVVIYNTKYDELKAALEKIAAELDSESRWAGNSLSLPTLGIQFYIERFSLLRNVSLKACGANQDLQGWVKFEKALRNELIRHRKSQGHSVSFALASTGLLLGGVALAILLTHPQAALEAVSFLLK